MESEMVDLLSGVGDGGSINIRVHRGSPLHLAAPTGAKIAGLSNPTVEQVAAPQSRGERSIHKVPTAALLGRG